MNILEKLKGSSIAVIGLGYLGKRLYSFLDYYSLKYNYKIQGFSRENIDKIKNSEFDYVLVALCHIVNGQRKHYTDWSYSLISSVKLEDVNNKGYCLPHIPSALLLENKYDNIYMLTNKLKNLE